jgi:hypothetical protein
MRMVQRTAPISTQSPQRVGTGSPAQSLTPGDSSPRKRVTPIGQNLCAEVLGSSASNGVNGGDYLGTFLSQRAARRAIERHLKAQG